MKESLLGLDTTELRALMQQEGEQSYRGSQLAEWIYRHGAGTLDDMRVFPAELRNRLGQKYEIGRSKSVTLQQGRDGTFKLLLEMKDGARVETVGLPYADRFSCCVSTQVGCPVGCVFCASGQDGYVRNLQPGEIVGQVLAINEAVKSGKARISSRSNTVDHVVIMGTGEPLLNYDSTLKAIRLLNNEVGIGIRHLTVSTVGIVPEILRLADEKLQVTPAISLHAPNDELRRRIVPGIKKWSVAEIVSAGREYVRKTGRRITFEYCMLDGLNDGENEARELAQILKGLNCHVNLIRYNPVNGIPYAASSREKVSKFRSILESAGIQVTQRLQRGADIAAACGQLRRQAGE